MDATSSLGSPSAAAARTGSAFQGRVSASFVLLLVISPRSSPLGHNWGQDTGQAGPLFSAVQLFLVFPKRCLISLRMSLREIVGSLLNKAEPGFFFWAGQCAEDKGRPCSWEVGKQRKFQGIRSVPEGCEELLRGLRTFLL